MKQTILCAFMAIGAFQINAQVQTPHPSPSAAIDQTVGLTEVSVDYSRPSLRGRTIFGDLVPFDKIWRTGANENTVISFSDAVTIGGQIVPKGDYAL